MRLLLLVTAMLLWCSQGQTWAADGVNAPDKAAADIPEAVTFVCKRVVRTGTHLRTRVCRTRATIEKEREDAKRFMQKAERYQRALILEQGQQ